MALRLDEQVAEVGRQVESGRMRGDDVLVLVDLLADERPFAAVLLADGAVLHRRSLKGRRGD